MKRITQFAKENPFETSFMISGFIMVLGPAIGGLSQIVALENVHDRDHYHYWMCWFNIGWYVTLVGATVLCTRVVYDAWVTFRE